MEKRKKEFKYLGMAEKRLFRNWELRDLERALDKYHRGQVADTPLQEIYRKMMVEEINNRIV